MAISFDLSGPPRVGVLQVVSAGGRAPVKGREGSFGSSLGG